MAFTAQCCFAIRLIFLSLRAEVSLGGEGNAIWPTFKMLASSKERLWHPRPNTGMLALLAKSLPVLSHRRSCSWKLQQLAGLIHYASVSLAVKERGND